MRRSRRAQQGWIGLVALLLAILIVAWLGKSALTSYGLTSPKPAPGTPSSDPRERARAVEQTIIEKARETAREVEEAEKQ